jgi:hypothetical protein
MLCGEKARYATKKMAQTVRNKRLHEKRREKYLRIYPCPFCRGYHLTSKRFINMRKIYQ